MEWFTESLIMSFTTMGIFEDGDSSDQYNGVYTSNDRSCIVVGDDDGCVKLFNYPCVVKNAPYKERGAHCSHVSSVCFVADDSYAVSVGAKDRGVFCWKLLGKGEEGEGGKCESTFGWEEDEYSAFEVSVFDTRSESHSSDTGLLDPIRTTTMTNSSIHPSFYPGRRGGGGGAGPRPG